MQHDANLKNTELARYQIYSRREMGMVLRSLQKHRQQVMLSIQSAAHTGITSVLQVDAEGDSIVMDLTSDSVLNQKVLKAGSVKLEARLDGIAIFWDVPRVEACLFDDRPAYVFPFPVVLTRLQRREHYRINTPQDRALHCTILIREESEKTVATIRLGNISGGGVGLIDEKHELDATFGRIYDNCEIALPNYTFLVVKLEVRSCLARSSFNGKAARWIGCQFIDLPRPMLTSLQRYITALEQEQCRNGVNLMQLLK